MDLTNRIAKCVCGMEMPSSTDLSFFKFRGQGSRDAESDCAICRFHEVAHVRANELNEPHLARVRGHEFTPHGAFESDAFYCGCRGWD